MNALAGAFDSLRPDRRGRADIVDARPLGTDRPAAGQVFCLPTGFGPANMAVLGTECCERS